MGPLAFARDGYARLMRDDMVFWEFDRSGLFCLAWSTRGRLSNKYHFFDCYML
jgi:hypothetical protein